MKDKSEKEIKDFKAKNGLGKSCPKIDVVNVGQGTSGYQGDFTKREIDIIKSEMENRKTLHIFSGSSKLGDIRVDFANPNATHKGDVCEFLRNYNPDENTKVVLLDPPYAHEKSKKEYRKTENIYLSQEKKNLMKESDLFVVFDKENPQKTKGLFDLITKKVKPEKIIMKSWNYYVPEGYHDTCRTSAGYSGGYKKTTYLMVLERNDIQHAQKEPIYETKEKLPVIVGEKDDLKINKEKEKKKLSEGKKTLIIDKSIADPFKF